MTTQQIDFDAAGDAAHLAATVTFLRVYGEHIGVKVALDDNPTVQAVQRAARQCGLRIVAEVLDS